MAFTRSGVQLPHPPLKQGNDLRKQPCIDLQPFLAAFENLTPASCTSRESIEPFGPTGVFLQNLVYRRVHHASSSVVP